MCAPEGISLRKTGKKLEGFFFAWNQVFCSTIHDVSIFLNKLKKKRNRKEIKM